MELARLGTVGIGDAPVGLTDRQYLERKILPPALSESFSNTRESYVPAMRRDLENSRRRGSPGPRGTPWTPPSRVRSMSASPGTHRSREDNARGTFRDARGGHRFLNKRHNNENTPSPNPKRSRDGEEGPFEKPDWKTLKKEKKAVKEERQISKKGLEVYNIRRDAKCIWEDLRRKDCPEQRKSELSVALFDLIKPHLTPFILTHDMSRIIETLMVSGSTEMRQVVLGCYKDLPKLGWLKYSNHVILKAMNHATIELKKSMYEVYRPHFMHLMAEPYGRELGEVIFDGINRESHRLSFISEAFGKSYELHRQLNARTEYMTAKEWVTSRPLLRTEAIKFMKFALNKMLNRVNPIPLKNHPLHALLSHYFDICSVEEKNEILEQTKFRDHILEILPTKTGSTLVMQVFWDSTAKDRKNMVKSLKGEVCGIAGKQHGHMVLLAMLDSLDDTSLTKKAIITELMRNVTVVMATPQGRKVIRYLIDPRNKMDFTPDLIASLAKGDENPYSKKDMDTRRLEILKAVKDELLTAVIEHGESWVRSGNCASVVTSILLKCEGSKSEEAMDEIVRLITHKQPFECIQHGGTFFMVKKLIGHEGRLTVVNEGTVPLSLSPARHREKDPLNIKFTNALIQKFTKKSMENWLESPQGSALILGILETYPRDLMIQKALFQKVKLCDYATILGKEQKEVRSKANLLMMLRRLACLEDC